MRDAGRARTAFAAIATPATMVAAAARRAAGAVAHLADALVIDAIPVDEIVTVDELVTLLRQNAADQPNAYLRAGSDAWAAFRAGVKPGPMPVPLRLPAPTLPGLVIDPALAPDQWQLVGDDGEVRRAGRIGAGS